MQENLRLASSILTAALRNTRYGVPAGNPSSWINWVSGFTTNPNWTNGGGGSPDTISVAACFEKPVGRLSVAPLVNTDTTLQVTPSGVLTDALDTGAKSFIRIGESEFARVTSVGSNAIMIDTDLVTAGNQPVREAHAGGADGAEICRVDVITFSVDTATSRLMRNQNQGGVAQPVAEGISDLQITPTPPKQYTIALTAIPEKGRDPVTGYLTTRTLTTNVLMRN